MHDPNHAAAWRSVPTKAVKNKRDASYQIDQEYLASNQDWNYFDTGRQKKVRPKRVEKSPNVARDFVPFTSFKHDELR